MMTATKAVAGGVAANIVTIVLWAISSIPGWKAVPEEPRSAIIALVSAAVGAAIVYLAPANKETPSAAAPVSDRQAQAAGALQPSGALSGSTN